MTSEDIRPGQRQRLHAVIVRQLQYHRKLLRRMEWLGFRGDDSLYLAVLQSHDALHAVNVELHYLSCGKGRAGR